LAASSIEVNHDPDKNEDDWLTTPYQVADARHDPSQAARLAVQDCGRDWYAWHSDDRGDEEILDALIRDAVIEELAA
jgi:hypothetical protein